MATRIIGCIVSFALVHVIQAICFFYVVQMIDPEKMGKPSAEGENSTKKGFKSAAFNAILPLTGWFNENSLCLKKTSCADNPVLKMASQIWNGWGPSGVSVAEVDSTSESPIPPDPRGY